MYEIRQVRMADGEILYLLADKVTGLPDAYVTRYIFVEVRSAGVSSGTIRNKLIAIGTGLTLVRELGIDIERRIAVGRYLDNEELHRFADLFTRRKDGAGRINGESAGDRYATFIDYLAFRTSEVRQYAPEVDHPMIARALEDFKRRAAKHRPHASSGAALNERLGLEPHLRDRFLEVIRPGHPENPFQTGLQVRNHAILLIAYIFGLRSGEEFSLKRSDFDDRAHPPTLTIHRRPDDRDDPRIEPALVKTLGRTLPIEGDALAALEAWLAERYDRARYPLARRHPYIFVARTGAPIGLRRGRQLYEQVRKAHPELGGLVQHMLRHDANDRWTEEDEEKKPDPTASRRQRTYAFGWTDGSDMPDKYGKAAIRRGAAKRIETIQKEGVGQKK